MKTRNQKTAAWKQNHGASHCPMPPMIPGHLSKSRIVQWLEKIWVKVPGRLSCYSTSRLEVYLISDLHTDFTENMAWVERLAMASYPATCGQRAVDRIEDGSAGPQRQTAILSNTGHAALDALDASCSSHEASSSPCMVASSLSTCMEASCSACIDLKDVQRVLIVAGDISDCLVTLE